MINNLSLLCKMWINKVVVGSSCGDVPKYMGEGVAAHGMPGTLGGPYHGITLNYSSFGYFLGDMLWTCHVRSVSPSLSM